MKTAESLPYLFGQPTDGLTGQQRIRLAPPISSLQVLQSVSNFFIQKPAGMTNDALLNIFYSKKKGNKQAGQSSQASSGTTMTSSNNLPLSRVALLAEQTHSQGRFRRTLCEWTGPATTEQRVSKGELTIAKSLGQTSGMGFGLRSASHTFLGSISATAEKTEASFGPEATVPAPRRRKLPTLAHQAPKVVFLRLTAARSLHTDSGAAKQPADSDEHTALRQSPNPTSAGVQPNAAARTARHQRLVAAHRRRCAGRRCERRQHTRCDRHYGRQQGQREGCETRQGQRQDQETTAHGGQATAASG